MVGVAQLVRASGCGPEGRGFESHHSPHTSFFILWPKSGYGGVAQLVRAFGSHPRGHGFEPPRLHHKEEKSHSGVAFYFCFKHIYSDVRELLGLCRIHGPELVKFCLTIRFHCVIIQLYYYA